MTRKPLLVRPVLAACLAIACGGTLALPAAAGPQDRLVRIHQRQSHVQQRIDAADNDVEVLVNHVAVLDARRAGLQAKVGRLDSRVATLDAHIGAVTGRLTTAQVTLAKLSGRLDNVLGRLARQRDILTRRAIEAYKEGPQSYLDGLLSAPSLSDLSDQYVYYQSALDSNMLIVDRVEVLERSLAGRRARVERREQDVRLVKDKLDATRAQVAQVRATRATALRGEQRTLTAKRRLLTQARTQKAHYEAILGELQHESDKIQGLLLAARSLGPGTVGPAGSGQLSWPASGPVTSGFGWRTDPVIGGRHLHAGIDIGAAEGAPVYAADDGTVLFVGQETGYGNVVAIDHGGGLATTYNHLSAFAVGIGDKVMRGQHIASVGCTGYCTGPHLHFEVRINGAPVDPMPYLK